MSETTHVVAGRCRTVFEGTREQTQHGDVLVVVKPDQTVLVHDEDGYQPIAWLTRPQSVTVAGDTILARDGDQSLEVTIEEEYDRVQYPTSSAGIPVGDCPDCDSNLVRTRGTVTCPDCDRGHSLPSGAVLLEESCSECGLPRIRVERGASFVVCLDASCESLDERVRAAFDREWSCPDCDGDLRVLRRGGLLLGCENYPECDRGFSFPQGIHDGTCECGLPRFERSSGQRCLDRECSHG